MFESLLANLLDKYASQYLEGIDSKSANLSIWKGDVSLRNLKVKTSAFDELKLPVTVLYGYLEELTLQIPWKDLKTKPVNVILKGLYVVLAPVPQDCLMSSSPDELQEALRKKARSAVDNLIKSEVAQKIPGFTERLLARILDNIQIQFERIHISYVDKTVASGKLSFGITVQGFTAKSADASGREAFVHESRILRKRVDLRCLSVYCNPGYDILQKINLNQPFISAKSAQDAANSYLQQLIATSADHASPLAKHILLPLSTVTVIEINKNDEPDAKIPKYSVVLNVPKIELRISNAQLNGLSEVAALLAQRSRIQFYRSYRVPFRPIVKDSDRFSKERGVLPTAAQKWRFACDAVVAELHQMQRLNRFSAARFMSIMRNISRYKQLCCIPSKLLKPNEIEEMQRIDVLIPIDFLRIVRCKTVPDLIARSAAASDQVSTCSSSQGEKKKKGWLRGWFSKNEKEPLKGQDTVTGGEASFGLGLSASEERQLLDTIDTSDAELGAQGTPVLNAAEWVKMKLSLAIGELSILLQESRSGNTGNALGQFTLSSVNAVYRVRPSGWGLNADMRDLTLSDLIIYDVGRTSFPHIIKRAPSVKDNDVLLSLHVECNPPDGSCAMTVSACAQPLTIVYHQEYIAALQAIFAVAPPSNLLVPVSNTLKAAPKSSSAANIRRARLIVASATALDIDLAAPIILVPQNGFLVSDRSSALLVLALGRFQLTTFLVSSLKREELSNEPQALENMCCAAELACEALADNPECLTCESIPPAVACVYDRMLLKVTGLKSLMCSVADSWWDAAAVASGGWQFVLPIDIDIAVLKLVCTSPLAVPLRVAVAIQNVQLNISRNNYMALFKIIDVFKSNKAQDNSKSSSLKKTEIEGVAMISNDTNEVEHASGSVDISSSEESSSAQDKVSSMTVTIASKKLAIAMFCSDGSFNFSNCVPALALTDVSVQGLYVSYRSFPSGSSTVSSTIGSFIISDVRTPQTVAPCFRQILRLVRLHADRPALSVIYDTNARNKITTTNVSLHNLEILLISEPLALVAAIFVSSKPQPASADSSKSIAPVSGTSNTSQVKHTASPASSWTSEMNIFVINPNVALISNPADPASPRLNLNLSLMYHADSCAQVSSTRMCVQELNILRSVDGKAQADWDRLLEPASVTIEVAAAPVLKNVTLLVKALAFKVSYADIRMLYSSYLTASKTFTGLLCICVLVARLWI
jgi:vacuolar protein sorting-associated protein 13A/C